MGDRTALLVFGLCMGAAWAADEPPDEDETQDIDFIEYLGLWDDSDEEWVMLDVVQDGEEATEIEPETQDES